MDYAQHMDMTMCDIKPILPPYPGVGGAAGAGFHGLNGLSMQDQSLTNQQMFLSSFRGSPGLPQYDYRRSGNTCDMGPSQTKSPSPPPRIYKPCVVCNDKSSGYHYGVSSCEGCKGFFRRSVQKNITYACQKDSNCEINKVTRNRCQHCRLKKCFDKGMSKEGLYRPSPVCRRRLKNHVDKGMSEEAVRNDRKKKTPESGNSVTNNNSSNAKSNEPVNHITDKDRQLIDLILDAHRSTLPGGPALPHSKNADETSPSQHSVSSPVPSTCSNMTGESSDNCRPSPDTTTLDSMGPLNSPATPNSAAPSPSARPGWDNVDELNSEGIVKVVEFAKKIPYFLNLTVTDQITLLKAACLEVLILRLTMRYRLPDDTLTFSNGVSINEMEMTRGGFGPLAQTIFKFSAALHEMSLDETEFALLTVICLLSSDRSGLENSSEVEKVQEPFLVALQHYTKQKRFNQPHLFAKLLMKLTDLRSISIKGADKVLHLRQDSTDNIPPLVVEMFDRTENVCIP